MNCCCCYFDDHLVQLVGDGSIVSALDSLPEDCHPQIVIESKHQEYYDHHQEDVEQHFVDYQRSLPLPLHHHHHGDYCYSC